MQSHYIKTSLLLFSMEPYVKAIFEPSRQYLTAYHDEREEVIRYCRDITSISKKIIFSTHRVTSEINAEIRIQLLSHFTKLAAAISQVYEIYSNSARFASYKSSISNAVEEMVEAFTFLYFTTTGDVLSYETFLSATDMIIKAMVEPGLEILTGGIDVEGVNEISKFITKADFCMGLFDLTGEIMRYSIVRISSLKGGLDNDIVKNLQLMRSIYGAFDQLMMEYPNLLVNQGSFSSDKAGKNVEAMKKKLLVLKQSISKVEDAICQVAIKGNELIDLEM